MSDLPLTLPDALAASLTLALDQERKIDRALETLGAVAGRDVVVVGGGADEIARLAATGARIATLDELPGAGSSALPDASADAVVSRWAAFRGVEPTALAEVDRILRPGGRLLVVLDYGRDDVSRLRGDLPEYGAWSRRDGPYLANGFRMRVLHCFWTFDTLDAARAFLVEAFGDAGAELAEGLKRPRLSWNVAVYHRPREGALAASAVDAGSAPAD